MTPDPNRATARRAGVRWNCSRGVTTLVAIVLSASIAAAPLPGAAQSEPKPADDAPAAFNPMMGALMSMFIQPRHAKLGLAGREANWPLTAYELKELQRSLAQISAAIPRWKGLPVPDLFDAALTEPMAALESAVKAGDTRQFAEAFEQLTTGCNACHATTDHMFVVLKAPEASDFPDQEFKPRR
jgi:hypothetical protein